jgi:hypothetical protein
VRCALPILFLGFLLAQDGCSYSLRKYNTPSKEKLHIETTSPTNCIVRIAVAESFSVATDGRVTFDVPRLPRGCDVHFLGIIKIRDGGPESVEAIHVVRNGMVVRKLSLKKLGKLPMDVEGYHILVLK